MSEDSLEQPSPLRPVPTRTTGDTSLYEGDAARAARIVDEFPVTWDSHEERQGFIEYIAAALRAERVKVWEAVIQEGHRYGFDSQLARPDSRYQHEFMAWCRQQAQEEG